MSQESGVFEPDGKMYVGQGKATNNEVVRKNNGWVTNHPFFHNDYPGSSILLDGQIYETSDFLRTFAQSLKQGL